FREAHVLAHALADVDEHAEMERRGAFDRAAGGEVTNRLLLPVLVDLEVVAREIDDEAAFLVADCHPEVDEVDPALEHRDLLRGACGTRHEGHKGHEDQNQKALCPQCPLCRHHGALYTRRGSSATSTGRIIPV